ncbi:MAG: FAD-dependent thymidylate synthase [Candidatus Zixiibacteriota bacterium]
MAFAKTSRSPESFDQIAQQLTESTSAQFHEKWVVGYGHASVAEHAILSLAVENVSILAAKAIEDNRLASYTEKSTRYQVYDPEHVYRPAKIMSDPEIGPRYEQTIKTLLEAYISWSDTALTHLRRQNPCPPDKSERMWLSRLRARACDAIRYLLPTATLTNLGWTVNARALAHAIRKLGASPLEEFREIADELRESARRRVPTLLKYCDPDIARVQSAQAVSELVSGQSAIPPRIHGEVPPEVRIVQAQPNALDTLCSALVYSTQTDNWSAVTSIVRSWSTDQKLDAVRRALAHLGPHDPLPRAFEHCHYLVEITIDYGAWRDIQRHRMATQTAQELTPNLGITIPALIDELGLRDEFVRLAALSEDTFDTIAARYPHEAVYALMLAFRKRSLFDWNLREIHHFVKLRGSSKGHDAYRRAAIDLWRSMISAEPWMAEVLFPLGESFA